MSRTKILGQPVDVEGSIVHGASEEGNPVGVGASARTTNPTAVGNSTRVRLMADDLGKLITQPHTVRDLLVTAYASISTGTKASLVTGVSGFYLDLVQVSFGNNSTALATIALMDESTTIQTFSIPAGGTVIHNFACPIPQSSTGVDWYLDMIDITGTTVTVQAVFSKTV